ncbi:MAG TPA: hypothetical protein VFM15_05175 [Gammaproteobacteria bacterium]|nr:hypothetical protein [Gammaproteobacteria bacterium]
MFGMTAPEGLLSTEEYQLLAAVPLQAAAEVAAQRGDPQLFNDMPVMLGLLGSVTALTHAYLGGESVFAHRSSDAALEATPTAVCALVFSESNLEPGEVQACLQALSSAYLHLLKQGVLGPQEAYVEQAYTHLLAGERLKALQALKRAIHAMAGTVDAWEQRRAAAANEAAGE